MKLLNANMLEGIIDNNKRESAGLLPELVKRLIVTSVMRISSIRIPGKDDIWAPGFDGIVECDESTLHICSGKSVWEFGTNNDSLKKINKDYNTRTNDSLGIDRTSTAFYLVVPKIWSFSKSISKWEEEHKEEWAKVHVIDASELCDWINSLPSVCCWLLENYYNQEILSFTSVSKAWEQFKQKTEPHLSQNLFLVGRQTETELLNANTEKSILRIQSNSFIDAVGFTIASVLHHKDNKETFVVVDNETTFKQLNRIIKNQTFIFAFHYDGDVILENDNSAILCFSDADISIKPDMKLNKLSKKNFEDSLKNMGIADIDASRLSKFTDRNVAALLRKIPGIVNITKPKWADGLDVAYLIPMLFMRKINKENEVDRKIVELFGVTYKEFENKMNALAKLEDRPIKAVDRYYSIIHYEEIWSFLQLTTSDSCYQTLINLITAVLAGAKEQQVSQEYDVAFLKSIEGRLFSNLLTNLVYFASGSDTDKLRVVKDIKNILKVMVEFNYRHFLLENLSILANAAPKEVMNFINSNLEKGGFIDSLFSNPGYDHDYCKILWALETLLKFDESKFNACMVLKELYL